MRENRGDDLATLQAWFFERITRGGGTGDAPITGRLDVYADAYFVRLLDVIRDDYPCVAAHVGEPTFRRLVREYLSAYPSRRPSLRYAGREFPGFLQAHPLTESSPWLPDLAALEWARVEVFDAVNDPPLALADLAGVSAEGWPRVVFAIAPWVRLARTTYPVHRAWRSSEDGEVAPEMMPEPTTIAVWRADYVVRHRVAARDEAVALEKLDAGEPFAAICEVYADATSGDVTAAAARAFGALQQWIVDGWIAPVREER